MTTVPFSNCVNTSVRFKKGKCASRRHDTMASATLPSVPVIGTVTFVAWYVYTHCATKSDGMAGPMGKDCPIAWSIALYNARDSTATAARDAVDGIFDVN